jgi:prophage regulatory protein
MTRLLRLPDVKTLTGLSRDTIERMMAVGEFPQAVRPTPMTRAWRSDELQSWIDGLQRVAA